MTSKKILDNKLLLEFEEKRVYGKIRRGRGRSKTNFKKMLPHLNSLLRG